MHHINMCRIDEIDIDRDLNKNWQAPTGLDPASFGLSDLLFLKEVESLEQTYF